MNVQILGISASNPFSQKMFADSMKLQYPLLSDFPDLKVIKSYGVLMHIGESKRPMARGAYFLIDKAGIVQGRWFNPPDEVFPSNPFLKVAQQMKESH